MYYFVYSLTTALQASEEKTQQLELKLSQILMEKNRKIEELEQRINELQEHKVYEMDGVVIDLVAIGNVHTHC